MKQLDDEKREKSKKIIDAIGGLQDDMISKANPENWEQGVYIGEKSGENNSNDSYEDKNKVVLSKEKKSCGICCNTFCLCYRVGSMEAKFYGF